MIDEKHESSKSIDSTIASLFLHINQIIDSLLIELFINSYYIIQQPSLISLRTSYLPSEVFITFEPAPKE